MKKFVMQTVGGTFLVAVVVGVSSLALRDMLSLNTIQKPETQEVLAAKTKCASITGKFDDSNAILYSTGHYLEGQLIRPGYDEFGYNYQAKMFKGSYANAYLGRDGYPPYEGSDDAYLAENPGAESTWYWPYREVDLEMKWNDAWLSSSDCDNNGALDRHYGFDNYLNSGAWLTNHMKPTPKSVEGGENWTYFVKIVAVPDSATLTEGIWYAEDGGEIGPEIWGQFAVIQELDTESGAKYVSPGGPGFGKF